jgi:hypothetical protein
MEPFITKIALGIVVCLWLFFCVSIYRKFRGAAWLAASTGASGLFFLGATIAASFMVAGALFLLPLWIGIAALKVIHLFSAYRMARENLSLSSSGSGAIDQRRADRSSNSALDGQSESDMYI